MVAIAFQERQAHFRLELTKDNGSFVLRDCQQGIVMGAQPEPIVLKGSKSGKEMS